MSGASRNPKIHTLCEPWYGERGPAFTVIFWPDLTAALGARRDKFATLAQHLLGTDRGGLPPSTANQIAANPQHVSFIVPHLPAGGAAAAIAARDESAIAFTQRSSELVSLMRAHIEVPAIRSDIDKMVKLSASDDYANGAPVITFNRVGGVCMYPPNHPNAGAAIVGQDLAMLQQCGTSLARHVAAMIIRQGSHAMSGLRVQTLNEVWSNLKISVVGYTARTMLDINSKIEQLSDQQQVPKTEEEKRIKFLSMIVYPALCRAGNAFHFC